MVQPIMRGVETIATMPNVDGTPRAEFHVSAELVRVAPLGRRAKGAEWKDSADQWRVTIVCRKHVGGLVVFSEFGRMTLDYWTGTGNRKDSNGTRIPFNRRDYNHDSYRFRPVHPSANDMLICIGSDWHTAEEMPRDDGAAMDSLAADGLASPDGKPSETLAMVRALRKIHDDIGHMLQGSGIAPAGFAAWCATLDS
jgi:hypothetical protein